MDLFSIGTVVGGMGPIGSVAVTWGIAHGLYATKPGDDFKLEVVLVATALGSAVLGTLIGAPYLHTYEKRAIRTASGMLTSLAVPGLPLYSFAAWQASHVPALAPLVPFFLALAVSLPLGALVTGVLSKVTAPPPSK